MLNLTPAGMDLRKTFSAETSIGMFPPILPLRSATKTNSGRIGAIENLGTRVAIKARCFGMVGWVSRSALGMPISLE